MRKILLSIAIVLAFTPGWSGEPRLPLYGPSPRVRYAPVVLDTHDPKRTRVGALTYLGGLRLWSDDPAFGGFSAMAIRGERLTLLNDGGLVFSFRMGADWRPHGARFDTLPDGPRSGWSRSDRDSESMAVDPATGRIWVGFENANAIWRYAPGFIRAEAIATPTPMADWPLNGGAEAMVRLRSGRFLVISEDERVQGKPRVREVLAFDRDPTDRRARFFRFGFRPPRGYSPTDVAELPDGRLLVLTRALSPIDLFTSKLVLIDPRTIAPGAVLEGRMIATLAAPTLHDNFEGLAITREGDSPIVWIVSDDNAPTWFQRTLLLKFRLDLADR